MTIEELKQHCRWVLWRLEVVRNNRGELVPTKVPYQLNGAHASSTDPSTWCTHAQAQAHVGSYTGVGVMMGDGLVMMTEARGASNAKAKSELGWTLQYPSWRQGFAAVYKGLAGRASPGARAGRWRARGRQVPGCWDRFGRPDGDAPPERDVPE